MLSEKREVLLVGESKTVIVDGLKDAVTLHILGEANDTSLMSRDFTTQTEWSLPSLS